MTEVVITFEVKQDLVPEYKDWVKKSADSFAQHAVPGLRYIGTWISKLGVTNQVERRFFVEDFQALQNLVEGKRTETQQKLVAEERRFVSGSVVTTVLAKIC